MDEGTVDDSAVASKSSSVMRRMSVASVEVSLAVGVALGVFVAVGDGVKLAVGEGVTVGVLVAVFVGSEAAVGSSGTVSLMRILYAKKAAATPKRISAVIPANHFFKRLTPVSALA